MHIREKPLRQPLDDNDKHGLREASRDMANSLDSRAILSVATLASTCKRLLGKQFARLGQGGTRPLVPIPPRDYLIYTQF